MVVPKFSPRTQDSEAGIYLRDQGQPDLQCESRIVSDISNKNPTLKLIITKVLKDSIHDKPKNYTKEVLQLVNIVSNVTGYKINSKKSVSLLYKKDQ